MFFSWILNFADGIHDLIVASENKNDERQHLVLWIIEVCFSVYISFILLSWDVTSLKRRHRPRRPWKQFFWKNTDVKFLFQENYDIFYFYRHVSMWLTSVTRIRENDECILDSAPIPFQLKLKESMHINWNKPNLNSQLKRFHLTLTL